MSAILKFCKGYEKKIKNDKDIRENTMSDSMHDYRDRVSFHVVIHESAPGYRMVSMFGSNSGSSTIILDDEDLKILYEKYSKKMIHEMASRIEEITKLYDTN